MKVGAQSVKEAPWGHESGEGGSGEGGTGGLGGNERGACGRARE